MAAFNMDMIQEMVLTSLRDLLPSLRRFNDKQLVAKLGKEKFEDASGQIADYVEVGCGLISRNEYLALLSQLLKCLSNYLQDCGAPITANNLINSIHLMPQSVEQAFPGYSEAGLLRCIVVREGKLQEVRRVQLVAVG